MKPDWHDRPTEPGLWVSDEGRPDLPLTWLTFRVTADSLAGWNDGSRYCGPLPPDTKEEKMSSQHEIEYSAREIACAEAWDAYIAARPDLPRDPLYERLFIAGFDRGWRAKEEK